MINISFHIIILHLATGFEGNMRSLRPRTTLLPDAVRLQFGVKVWQNKLQSLT